MASVLVVDDDAHIRDVMRFALEQAGHAVAEAQDGAAALELFARGGFDIVLLDIVMPEQDGLDVCRRIREKHRVPIIFVSSRDDEIDRVLGLELGGDDYITKPFSPRELVARVKAVLRRTQEAATPLAPDEKPLVLTHGPIVMDIRRHACSCAGVELTLTVTEFALLRTLVTTPGRVYSRGELVDLAYGHGHVITERTVDSHIRRIRKKLRAPAEEAIETVYGLGYRMREQI